MLEHGPHHMNILVATWHHIIVKLPHAIPCWNQKTMHQQTLIDQRCLDHMRQSKHWYQRSSLDMRQSETLVSEIIWYDKKQLQCSLTYNSQYPELTSASLKMRTIILSLTKPEISEPHIPNSSATFWKLSLYNFNVYTKAWKRKVSLYFTIYTNTWKRKVSLYFDVLYWGLEEESLTILRYLILILERQKSHYTSKYNKNFTLHI